MALWPFNPRCKRDLVGLVITASLLAVEFLTSISQLAPWRHFLYV